MLASRAESRHLLCGGNIQLNKLYVRFALAPLLLAVNMLCVAPLWAAVAPSEVEALLARMAAATRQLDYRGLFTYEYGGSQETLRVSHSVANGSEIESLEHLTGPAREILRVGRRVDCHYIGDQLLSGRVRALSSNYASLEHLYHFYVRGLDRIAGREAWVVDVVPRDQFRYGYSLSIDRETGLLLKSLLVGRNKKILERFQFVELELGPVTAMTSNAGDATLARVSSSRRVVDHALSECNLTAPPESEVWQATWLPAGFVLTGQERKKLDAESAWRDVLMYTDGLSSFSAFIEPVAAVAALEGRAQRGATAVYLSRLQVQDSYYRVTIVGEIPMQAAQRVASAIEPLLSSSVIAK